MRRPALVLALVVVYATGCGDGGEPVPTSSTFVDRPAEEISYDPSQPWVITAVDNHFHDSHPTPLLDPDSVLIVKNGGSNLHNVTIVGTDFSQDIAPGEEIVFDPITSVMSPPGPYVLLCNYHASQDMRGDIRFAAG